ncbi:beta-1,3-glucosyltransferase-like isoform X1 [Stegodyphus dumicola]|uniref:beta-1,3-glucosyltransferase-like isoform X1 n=1 Tax=Stegodyphus dumicola TaxID=202533 RepID=UPI0015A7A62C|nr:beta-1,3-glucosyltransferase-like isoform X1 [Stegodyphus dumicola]
MKLCLCLIFIFCFFIGNLALTACMARVGFLILSQENSYHKKLALLKEKDIYSQVKNLNLVNATVYKTHKDLDITVGHWVIYSLFEKISKLPEFSWIFFLEDTTAIDIEKLIKVFAKYNSSEDVFVGYALRDAEPTIIHHFASADKETSILYPHTAAGFFLSFSLIKRLASRLPIKKENMFSIDPKYELAVVISNEVAVKLIHEPQLCTIRKESCATWIQWEFPNCGQEVSSEKVHVAVKTCHKFHADRVKIMKSTWAPDVDHLNIFSDVNDDSIPTIQLNVKNVPNGHCEKTLAIMRFYIVNRVPFKWLVIVDDDTLLNFHRLKKLLTCYHPSEKVALGERYGYSVTNGLGYDYLTGGAGMVFSAPTVKKLIETCQCPSIDSPDDMIIGICLKKLNIPVIHSSHFHQGRPIDYSVDFLQPQKHVSFHKHWMVNPYDIYNDWLQERLNKEQHMEL